MTPTGPNARKSRQQALMMRQTKRIKLADLIHLANVPNLDLITFRSILFSERRQGIKILAERSDIPVEWRLEAMENKYGPNYSVSKKLEIVKKLLSNPDLSDSEIKFLETKRQSFELQIFKSKYKSFSEASLERKLLHLEDQFTSTTNKLIRKEIFLQKLLAIRDHTLRFDSSSIERSKFLVNYLDRDFFGLHSKLNREIPQVVGSFNGGKSEHDLLHYSAIVSHLLKSSKVVQEDSNQNRALLTQGQEIFGISFNVYDERITNWSNSAFVCFILLLPWDTNTMLVSKSVFECLTAFVRRVGSDIGAATAEANALADAEKKSVEEEKNKEAQQERERQEQSQRDRARSEESNKKRREAFQLEQDCKKLIKELEYRFPWPVIRLQITTALQQKLEQAGYVVQDNKVFKKREPSTFSIFENYSLEFPKDKMFLVENIREFVRFVDHESRYLIHAVYLKLTLPFGAVIVRFDQVALTREGGVMYGSWVITMFGLPVEIRDKFEESGWRRLINSNFVTRSSLSAEELKVIDSVYFVKKLTEQGAKSAIGKLVEFFEFELSLDVSEARTTVINLPPAERARRTNFFQLALKRTFWKGERTSGPGLHHCLICGHEIWDAPSLARGIGPDCWRKVRYTSQGVAVLSVSGHDGLFDERRDALAGDLRAWLSEISRDFVRFLELS